MMMRTGLVSLILGLHWCVCQQPFYLLSTAPSSVAINRDNGEVFIAAGTQLLRLNNTLHLLETVTVSGELVRIALSPDGSELVGCLGGETRTCVVYSTSDLTGGAIAVVENAHYTAENGIAIITTPDSFYLGSEGGVGQGSIFNDNIFLVQYNYTANLIRSTGIDRYRVDSGAFIRHFYGGVSRNGYVYHIVADRGIDEAIRVLRVCDCARQLCSTTEFQALYELTLECRSSVAHTTRVCGVDLVETFGDQTGPLVVVTRCEEEGEGGLGGSRNRVCAFRLSDIDNDMDAFYDGCRAGFLSNFQLPWGVPTPCSSFRPTSSCDFGSIPGINVEETTDGSYQRFGFYLVNPGDPLITASLAIVVDGVSLMYVAHSGIIEVYEVTRLTVDNTPTGDHVATISDVPSVRDISWQEGSDYITITTDDMIFLRPLEACSDVVMCEECTGSFPLCGWCTVENQCSRSFQCQNSSEPQRWVTSSDQCIITTVTPQQYILATPSILNVTVRPDLPSNLSYNCSFSGSGEIFPLVVPAIELVAGSLYRCDITGTITTLDSVKQVTEFSFISVEVGIPFATNPSSLTIYNCMAALSCGECVDTEDACGWCLYGGFCSANSDPCPEPAGVNDTYLKLSGRSGSADVCPVVNAASTPSTYYTQPVGVARNLNLLTSNLPLPVDGFRYECQLRDLTFQAALNASEHTVSCFIPDGVITSSSFAEEVVVLEVIWTNGIDVAYPLNGNPTDDIMCILYECGELATSCSSCLGSNVAGYECGWCSARCSVIEDCTVDFSTTTDVCPSPLISSVQPNRGPIDGGTRVIIIGTNLGAVFSDIAQVRLRSDDGRTNVSCSLAGKMENYIPGLVIVCETEASESVGEHYLEVKVRRGSSQSELARVDFLVQQPVVSGIDPVFGPKSGDVEVVITGSDLDTGNTGETTVSLNGVNCVSIQVTDSSISCVSGSFDGNATSEGPVEVFIDNAIVSGVEFEFRDDPEFESVSPHTVIPAGGITLTFIGVNFNNVAQPVFIYTDADVTSSMEGPCDGSMETQMTCVVPPFTSDNDIKSNISYTVRAPGPDLTDELLTLNVKPNPSFGDNAIAKTSLSEGELLTITGTNLSSVDRGEINVRVGGVLCEDRGSNSDGVNFYVCLPVEPPTDQGPLQVEVFIGQNLYYQLGSVTYGATSEDDSIDLVGLTVGLGLGLPIGLFALVSLLFCCRWRVRKARSYVPQAVEFSNAETAIHGTVIEMAQKEMKSLIPQRFHIPSNQLHLLDSVGHGEFGEVYKARLVDWRGEKISHTVAVKTLRGLYSTADVQQMVQEVVKMQDFKHPHVMPLIGVCFDAGMGVVMPFMANGSVLNYLKRERETLFMNDEADIEQIIPARKLLLKICLQIARGMEYLAQQKFVHRDLAARNCMLDHGGDVRVGDFGLAEDMYSTGYVREDTKTVRIPYKWMPVESLEDGVFSELSDVWSFGVTCWEIFTVGKTPYPALDPPTLLRMLREGHRLEYPDNITCSPEIYAVMKKCWKLSPPDRPRFGDLTATLDKILMSVAGYTELSMTLVADTGEEEWPGYEVVQPPDENNAENYGTETTKTEIGMKSKPCYGMETAAKTDISLDSNPCYGTGSAIHESPI